MDPKYSVLLCGQSLVEFKDRVGEWLCQGIKVVWLGSDASCKELKDAYW